MPDYLSKAEWRKELKKNEHKAVKKTGISDRLDEITSANKTNDSSKKVAAYNALIKQIITVKGDPKYKNIKTLITYLNHMDGAAQAGRNSVQVGEDKQGVQSPADKKGPQPPVDKKGAQPPAEKPAAPEAEKKGKEPPLASHLKRIHTLDRKNAWHFCAAPGKPSSGLVVSKNAIKPDQRAEAMALRGKRGAHFTGICYGEAGKWVFELEDKPPAGLAKGIKLAAKLHADLMIKVLVRGGGVDIDDENDQDVDVADVDAKRGPQAATVAYPSAEEWTNRLKSLAALKPEQRFEVSFGITGQAKRYLAALENDQTLSEDEKRKQKRLLETVTQKAKELGDSADAPAEAPKTNYRTVDEWKKRIETIAQVDANSRHAAQKLLVEELKDAKQKVEADKSLSPQALKRELIVIAEANRLAKEMHKEQHEVTEGAEATGLAERVKRSEAEFQRALKNPLPKPVEAELRRQHEALRGALKARDQKAIIEAMLKLDLLSKDAASLGASATATDRKGREQAQQFENIRPTIEQAEKAALPNGTAREILGRKAELQIDDNLAKVVKFINVCEKDHSPKALKTLTDQCELSLKELEKQRQKAKGDDKKLKAIDARENVIKDALQRARLLEVVGEFQRLGPPPWDEATSQRATELQMTIMFEEAAIKRGPSGVPLALPPLADEGQANESYWVTRSESSDPDKKSEERLYIFKPAELENDDFFGMEKGKAAPREVLAKTMSDQLAQHGFKVDVCPTALTEVDRAKLGSKKKDEAPQTGRIMGATQALAKNKGPFRKMLESGQDLGEKIDPKNYGEIAVFDMIYFNIDRHSDNLLLGDEDPETGKVPLIPIDHGLGLLDKECAYANAGRLMTQSTLLKDNVPQKDELLHPDVRANLKSVDGVAMARSMAESRDGLAKRHPETEGAVSDEALQMMERRVAFLQYACDFLTAKELMEACALYLHEIVEARTPGDHKKIVDKVKERSPKLAKGRQDCARWTQAEKNALPAHKEVGAKQDIERITALGWCTEVREMETEINIWLQKNADLVARILATQMPNPAALAEIRERLQEINDPQFAQQLQGMTVRDQLEKVRAKAPKEWEQDPYDPDKAKMEKRYNDLGGDKAYAEATRLFPQKTDELGEKLWHLTRWKAFNDNGGVDAFLRLEGTQTKDLKVACARLIEARREETARADLMNMSDQEVEIRQLQSMTQAILDIRAELPNLTDVKKRAKFENELQQLESAMQQGKLDETQPTLIYMVKRVQGWKDGEAGLQKECGALLDSAEKFLEASSDALDNKTALGFGAKLDQHRKRVLEMDLDGRKREIQELHIEIDVAAKGDESDVRKAEAAMRHAKQLFDTVVKGALKGDALRDWHGKMHLAETSLAELELANALNFLAHLCLIGESVRDLPDLRRRVEQAVEGKEKLQKSLSNVDDYLLNSMMPELRKEMQSLREALG